MKKIMIIPTLTIGALLLGSMAFAWSGGPGYRNCDGPRDGRGMGMSHEQHQERMEQHLEFMAVALDLTDEQKEQLEAMGEQHWQTRQELRDKMQASRKELSDLGQSRDFDEAAFRAKAREQADLKTDMRAGHAKMKQAFFEVLTPQQREKAEKLWEMHGDGPMGRHGGKGMGMGDGMGSGMHGHKGKHCGPGMHSGS